MWSRYVRLRSERLMRAGIQALGICLLLILVASASAATDDVNICAQGEREARIAACSSAIESGQVRGHDLVLAYGRRGHAYVDTGDLDRAMADFEAAIRLDPKYFDGYNGRGRVYQARRDGVRALGEYEVAIRLDPNNPWPRNNRGNAYLSQGDTVHAIADYDEAIRLDPKIVRPHVNRGWLFFRVGDIDRSLADYEEVIRLDPNSAVGHTGVCRAYRDKGDRARALDECNEAIRLEPQYAVAYDNRGVVYHENGDEDRALADFGEAIRLDPRNPWPYNNRGISHFARGEKTLALADYDEAIRLDPTLVYAYFNRGDLYREQGDLGRALSEYQTALRLLLEGDRLKSQVVSRIAALQATAASPERRFALVIGNADYKNAALVNPTHDADRVSAGLRKIGFDVMEVKNADFAAFEDALNAFVAKEDRADIALFYFAGHGFAINGDDSRPHNYLMTTSADMSSKSDAYLRRDGITLDEVVNRISAAAKVTLAFVDACRNDPFHRGAGDRGFEPIGVALSRQIYIGMSTQLGRTALDGDDGKGSPFALAFVEKMSKPGLRIDDAFRALRSEVSRLTEGKQEPEVLQDGLNEGAIVLVRSP
jgi:tetratricopeptide (TPR) repeat protein